MSWPNQVAEEEQQGGMVSEEEPRFGSDLNPDAPLPMSEGGATSDVSMADDALTQLTRMLWWRRNVGGGYGDQCAS